MPFLIQQKEKQKCVAGLDIEPRTSGPYELVCPTDCAMDMCHIHNAQTISDFVLIFFFIFRSIGSTIGFQVIGS